MDIDNHKMIIMKHIATYCNHNIKNRRKMKNSNILSRLCVLTAEYYSFDYTYKTRSNGCILTKLKPMQAIWSNLIGMNECNTNIGCRYNCKQYMKAISDHITLCVAAITVELLALVDLTDGFISLV